MALIAFKLSSHFRKWMMVLGFTCAQSLQRWHLELEMVWWHQESTLHQSRSEDKRRRSESVPAEVNLSHDFWASGRILLLKIGSA